MTREKEAAPLLLDAAPAYDLTEGSHVRHEHSNPVEDAPHYGVCAGCGDPRPIGELRPVRPDLLDLPEPTDLGDLLYSRGHWLCVDGGGCRERAGLLVCAVIVPAETWAAGQIALITTDPRRAEEHAAAYRGVTVRWPLHSDYRPGRSTPR